MEREQLVRLVTAAQSGDSEAMNALFGAFYNDVYYFALKTVKSADLACDVTQETFVEIIHTLHKLQEPAAFVTWMKQITYHQCTRYFKKKKDILVDEDEDGGTVFDTLTEEHAEFIPDEALDQDEFKKTVLAILDTLSEEQRAATMMFYFDELPIKQIAEIQGVSENTVKSRLNYARKAIRKSVEEYEQAHNVKLHAVPMVPLFGWLFRGAFEGGMPAASAAAVAEGIGAATGTAVSVAATATAGATATATGAAAASTAAVGVGAKLAAIPLVGKIVAGVAAAAIVTGGGLVTGKLVMDALHRDEPPSRGAQSSVQDTVKPEQPEQPTVADELILEGVLPEGCTYVCADGTELKEGDAFPDVCTAGDHVWYGDYVYGYECIYVGNVEGGENHPWFMWEEVFDDGDSGLIHSDVFEAWSPRVVDMSKTEYGPIAARINGKPIRSLYGTFMQCTQLTEPPIIPSSVHTVSCTFSECTSLTRAPIIPKNVQRLTRAFYGCTALTGDVTIHATLDKSTFWFYYETFSATQKPINLVGDTPTEDLVLIAQNSDGDNVTVRGKAVKKDEPAAYAYTVPAGAVYTLEDGTRYEAGQTVPREAQVGDELLTADYLYRCGYKPLQLWESSTDAYSIGWGGSGSDQWGVRVRDTTKDQYEPLLGTINNRQLYCADYSFADCYNMVAAPELPATVTMAQYTYMNCRSLVKVPQLPSNLRIACGMFQYCSALVAAPELPQALYVMPNMFQGCSSLIEAPVFPEGVGDLFAAFADCTSLQTVPTVPASVHEMNLAFTGCSSLTGTIVVHARPNNEITDCFKDTVLPITLTGTSPALNELAATANNGNVTVTP